MFDYRKPCNDCPFRKATGHLYGLNEARLIDIFEGSAFECHKTTGVSGPKRAAQQCAGVMSILHKEGIPSQIMQVAQRLLGFDASQIDGSETYDSIKQCIAAHRDHWAPEEGQ
jgi:hypothetical protein